MVTDSNCTCGKHSITYGIVESLCSPFETNVTLHVNYIQKRLNVIYVCNHIYAINTQLNITQQQKKMFAIFISRNSYEHRIEALMLNERIQKAQDKYHMVSLIYGNKTSTTQNQNQTNNKIYRTNS